MFVKHKSYYTVEVELEDGSYSFVCSFATFNEANERVNALKEQTGASYRVLKIEKNVEEVS